MGCGQWAMEHRFTKYVENFKLNGYQIRNICIFLQFDKIFDFIKSNVRQRDAINESL